MAERRGAEGRTWGRRRGELAFGLAGSSTSSGAQWLEEVMGEDRRRAGVGFGLVTSSTSSGAQWLEEVMGEDRRRQFVQLLPPRTRGATTGQLASSRRPIEPKRRITPVRVHRSTSGLSRS